MQKYLSIVFQKMCRMIGADFKKIDFNARDWYLQHEWTDEDEKRFRNWLVGYLMKHPSAKQELMENSSAETALVCKWADRFIERFGWKIKQL
jgi:hypothetical protein